MFKRYKKLTIKVASGKTDVHEFNDVMANIDYGNRVIRLELKDSTLCFPFENIVVWSEQS